MFNRQRALTQRPAPRGAMVPQGQRPAMGHPQGGHLGRQGNRSGLIESASKGEMLEAYASRANLGDMLVDDWSGTREGARLDELYTADKGAARNTALAERMVHQAAS